MSSVGRIDLDLNINNRNFDRQVDNIGSRTKKKFEAMSIAIGNVLANLATQAVSSIGNFVKDSIDKGSELAELQNVVDSVFTTMSDTVDNFAQNALEAYGLTEAQAKRMMGTYGAMSKAFGYTERQAYSMSEQLTALTADVASFYNLNHDEAYTKMKSVFTGETESLKELGVVMTQAALDQYALQQGYGRTTAQMTEQEKVALRLAFVQDKLSVASGDFVRTQDQWANQTRILAGQFESLKASIGQGLINVLTPVIRVINIIMGKLVQLANAFKSFTAMMMGKSSSGGGGGSPASAMQDVAAAAGQAAEATGGISDAAGGAAASAKKAQKALMGFDEINKLTDTSSPSGGGGGGGGAGGGISFDDIDFGSVEEQQNKVNESLSKLKDLATEVFNAFKSGFKEGLGDDFEASLKRISNHLSGIKESAIDIFTDPAVKGAAANWVLSISKAIGQRTGSIVSIAQTIAENLIGGIDLYLRQNSAYIKQRIVGILDASAEIWSLVGEYWVALGSIFEVFRSPEAKECTANIIGIFSNAFLGVTQLVAQVERDILSCIIKPIIQNKDKIKTALVNILTPISLVLKVLNNSVKETFNNIFAMYNQSIKPMFEAFKNGISSVVSTLLDVFNNYVSPILDGWASKFAEVFQQRIQPLINNLIQFIGILASAIADIWQNVIAPFINWITSTIVPSILPVIQELGNIYFAFLGTVAEVINGVITILGGLINFIAGLFTGDWDRCWKGIKAIFEGIWIAISGFISGIWETIKGTIMAALKAIAGIIEIVLNSILRAVQTRWNLILNVFSTVLGAIKSLVSTVFKAIKSTVELIMNQIKSVINAILNAIKSTISTALNAIKSVVTSALNSIKSVISTTGSAIKTTVSTIWSGIRTTITKTVGAIKSGVSTGFNAMKTSISNVMDSIKTKITTVFKSIWTFVKGIINTMLGGIGALVNGLIDAINGMVGAVNKLKFSAPDWVPGIGGKKVGFNLSKVSKISIPKLAEGGYVRANQPQLAMIGDNKTQGEIVSPEDKMREVMSQALEIFFGKLMNQGYTNNNKNNGDGYGDLVIPVYLDGTILDEVIVTAQQRRNVRSGGR